MLGFLAVRALTGTDSTAAGDSLPLARLNFSQVWSGDELLVFGGWGNSDGEARVVFGDGAAFDPDAETWRPLAASPLEPRWGHEVLWTGDEMMVIGGVGLTDSAAYSPDTDSWRRLDEPAPYLSSGWETASAVEGSNLYVWVRREDDVWHFDANAERWQPLPRTDLIVDNGLLLATEGNLIALGLPFPDSPQVTQAALLPRGEDAWQLLPAVNLASNGQLDLGELAAAVVDDGEAILMWGSAGNGTAHLLNIAEGTWSDAAGPALIDCDGSPPPALADGRIIARSYCDGATIRDPATGEWSPTGLINDADPAPVWTGAELLGLGHDGEIYRWAD